MEKQKKFNLKHTCYSRAHFRRQLNLKQFPTSPLYRITLSKFRHFKSVVYSLHNINSWIKWKGNGAQIHYQEKPCMSSPYVRFPLLTNLISSIEILDFERKSYTWWSSTHLTRTAELEHHTNKSPMTLCGLNFFRVRVFPRNVCMKCYKQYEI